MIHGVINVYKEQGFTSHDVVAKLRGILKQRKIGHTGTLDPDATGVLPVCLGRATKLCDLLTDKNKTYEAVLLLGVTTDTQDMTGTILDENPVNVTETEIETCIAGFVGEYQQIPPMYSALKVDGKRLYELARAGKEIERKSRTVQFYEISITKIDLPKVFMKVTCSKGTYIRTLCYDIGQELGCGGAMQSLKRTQVERFTIDKSLKLSQIAQLVEKGTFAEHIIRIEDMFTQYPKVWAEKEQDAGLHNGNAWNHPENPIKDSQVRMYDSTGLFIGLYQYQEKEDRYHIVKMFMEAP